MNSVKRKIIYFILIIIFAILSYYYIENTKEKRHDEIFFLNSTRSYISDINRELEWLQNTYTTGVYKYYQDTIYYITRELYLLDQLLRNGTRFLNSEIGYISPPYGFDYIGTAFEGRLGREYQKGFAKDGFISENEMKFINQLYDDLEVLRISMVGDDGLNINRNLKIEEFANELGIFLEKWKPYSEMTPSGTTPYDYLLIEKKTP